MTRSRVFAVRSRFAAALLAAIFSTAFVGLSTASPALAHDALLSSNPQDGAKLGSAPKEIKLTFSEAPLQGTAKIIAVTSDAQPVTLDTPETNGKIVTVPWTTQAAGTYGIKWRVVSSDGHPIDGSFAFQILGSGSSSSAISTPTEAPSDSSTGTSAEPSPAAENTASSNSNMGMIAGLAVVIVVAVVLVMLLVRRRQNNNTPGDTGSKS